MEIGAIMNYSSDQGQESYKKTTWLDLPQNEDLRCGYKHLKE